MTVASYQTDLLHRVVVKLKREDYVPLSELLEGGAVKQVLIKLKYMNAIKNLTKGISGHKHSKSIVEEIFSV